MKVAVLGSGNGGCAVAYDFAAAGHSVFLWDMPEFSGNLQDISAAGGIHCEGELSGFAAIDYAGNDLEKTLDGAELVFAVGPAYSTEPFGKQCRPYVKPGQVFVICPSSCGGALAFKNALGLTPGDDSVWVAETSTLPYAVRILGQAKIHIYLKLKDGVLLATLPKSRNQAVLELLQPVYPCMTPAANVLQTTLQNANPVIHPSVTVLNAALVERTGGDFLFYEEGVTPAVGRVLKTVDEERIAIGKALGVEVIPDPQLAMRQGYMLENNYDTGFSKAPGFKGIKAQSRLDNRYLTEDVGYGLVFFSELAAQLGVPVPTMNALIHIASVLLDTDFRARRPRTMESLGLGGLSPQQIVEAL